MGWHNYKGKYDPAEFIVPPELDKGKSQRVQCYIQAAHYRLLNVVARCGLFPFEERNDVIRWCIQFGLQYLDTLEPGTTRSIMSQANIMNRRLQEQLHELKFQEWLHTARAVITQAVSQGEEDYVKGEVGYMWTEIQKMPDEPERSLHWKKKYVDAMYDNFGRWMPESERKAA